MIKNLCFKLNDNKKSIQILEKWVVRNTKMVKFFNQETTTSSAQLSKFPSSNETGGTKKKLHSFELKTSNCGEKCQSSLKVKELYVTPIIIPSNHYKYKFIVVTPHNGKGIKRLNKCRISDIQAANGQSRRIFQSLKRAKNRSQITISATFYNAIKQITYSIFAPSNQKCIRQPAST